MSGGMFGDFEEGKDEGQKKSYLDAQLDQTLFVPAY